MEIYNNRRVIYISEF